MKRINLIYGGINYSIAHRELDDLQNEIAAALKTANPYWLAVNYGEGTPREARLLITPGVDLALIPAPAPEEPAKFFTNQPTPPPAR